MTSEERLKEAIEEVLEDIGPVVIPKIQYELKKREKAYYVVEGQKFPIHIIEITEALQASKKVYCDEKQRWDVAYKG